MYHIVGYPVSNYLVLPHKGEASDHQEAVLADPAAVLGLGLWLLTAEPS